MVKNTPWGKPQSEDIIAEGISFYSTASHGGIKLDSKRNAMMPECFRRLNGWYEEDVDSGFVMLIFPQHFDEKTVTNAHYVIKNYHPDEYTIWSGKPVTPEESRTLRERIFHRDNANNYIAISAYGDWHPTVPKGMTGVVATLGGESNRIGSKAFFLVPSEEYRSNQGMGFVINPTKHQIWDNHP